MKQLSQAFVVLCSLIPTWSTSTAFARPDAAWPPAHDTPVELDDAVDADAVLGEWWTEGKGARVKIVKTTRGSYEVVLLDGNQADNKDVENPDPKLRERKLRGIVLIWNLRFDGEEYVDGYAYNPRDGETYRAKMWLKGPSTLRLRGYLAVPFLGLSQDWTRAN